MEKAIGYITALIGEPVRANVLWTLLDGRAYTATELAIRSDTSPQNISMHLNKLVKADLLAVESQGRHKYYRLSRQEVADAIEAIGNLVPAEKAKKIAEHKDHVAIRYCRTCYDHLAGKIGILLTESLIRQKILEPIASSYTLTKKGGDFFSTLEIDISELKKSRRIFAKQCLDWSERKHHLAGSLGAALFDKMLSLDWIRKTKNSRAVTVTSKGRRLLYDKFSITV